MRQPTSALSSIEKSKFVENFLSPYDIIDWQLLDSSFARLYSDCEVFSILNGVTVPH